MPQSASECLTHQLTSFSIPRLCSCPCSADDRLILKYPDSPPHVLPKEFCTSQWASEPSPPKPMMLTIWSHTVPVRQDRTGQDRTGQDRTGQDRKGQDRTGQDRTGQDRTGQERTGQERTGKDRKGHSLFSRQQWLFSPFGAGSRLWGRGVAAQPLRQKITLLPSYDSTYYYEKHVQKKHHPCLFEHNAHELKYFVIHK